MNTRNIRKGAKKVLESGQDLISNIISEAINTVTGDTTGISGTIGGNASCKVIQVIADKLDPCQLTEWEKQRVVNCMVSAIDKVKEQLNNGNKLRDDGFFEENLEGKANAEEVFESIVIASQREAEEMKQIFYGNMLANIGFIQYLDSEEFLFLLKVFEKLTYRQCLLLSIFLTNTISIKEGIHSFLTNKNPIEGTVDIKTVILYQEILDLYQKSLLFTTGNIPLSVKHIIPSELYTYAMGLSIIELTQVDHIVSTNQRLADKHLKNLKELTELLLIKSN
ncbi:hypothetical protein [Clostridium sp.]|uniref:hypothetical protein n=1 Tax=Clostridium sp. TaxID=1506 RepID=UPI0026167088|nr:hypothetical protein [Clostridium sp.]